MCSFSFLFSFSLSFSPSFFFPFSFFIFSLPFLFSLSYSLFLPPFSSFFFFSLLYYEHFCFPGQFFSIHIFNKCCKKKNSVVLFSPLDLKCIISFSNSKYIQLIHSVQDALACQESSLPCSHKRILEIAAKSCQVL